tara:strand:+ start:39 stop:149 length:111 start_codon:yes stop_codon:yes gene_type:complete
LYPEWEKGFASSSGFPNVVLFFALKAKAIINAKIIL